MKNKHKPTFRTKPQKARLLATLQQDFHLNVEEVSLVLDALRGEVPPPIYGYIEKRNFFANDRTQKTADEFYEFLESYWGKERYAFAAIYGVAVISTSIDWLMQKLLDLKQRLRQGVQG